MTLIRADGVSRIYRSASLVGTGAARTALEALVEWTARLQD